MERRDALDPTQGSCRISAGCFFRMRRWRMASARRVVPPFAAPLHSALSHRVAVVRRARACRSATVQRDERFRGWNECACRDLRREPVRQALRGLPGKGKRGPHATARSPTRRADRRRACRRQGRCRLEHGSRPRRPRARRCAPAWCREPGQAPSPRTHEVEVGARRQRELRRRALR